MPNGSSAATVVPHDRLAADGGFEARTLVATSHLCLPSGSDNPQSSLSRWRAIDAAELLVDGLRLRCLCVTRVLRRHSLDEGDQALLIANGVVDRTPRHDVEVPRAEGHDTVFVFDAKLAFQNEEQLVLVVVFVPR